MIQLSNFRIQLPPIEHDEATIHAENVAWEGELLGIYLTGHPLEASGIEFEHYPTLANLSEECEGEIIKLPVLCVSVSTNKTRNGKEMCRIVIEDGYRARSKGVLFPNMWQKTRKLLEETAILYIEGKVNTFNGETNLIINQLAKKVGKRWIVAK